MRAPNVGSQVVGKGPRRGRPPEELPTSSPRLWLVDSRTLSDAELARLSDRHLTTDERRHLAAVPSARRGLHAASYLLRRLVLSCAFGGPPGSWRFARDAKGRPFVRSPGFAQDLSISLARSGGVAAFAYVWDGLLGIDIETTAYAAPRLHHVVRTFSRDEQDGLAAAADKTARAIDLWVLKEAYGKALGVGLDMASGQGRFDLTDPSAPRLLAEGAADHRATGWHFALASPRPDVRLAIARRAAAGGPPTASVRWIDGLAAAYGLVEAHA